MLGPDDVEIEYIDGDDVVGAEEVVMDDDGMVMEDDIATESLVALSRGPNGKNKAMRTEYLQHAMPLPGKSTMRSPRILRRPVVDRGGYVYEQQVPRPQMIHKPNFPVPQHTKRLLPVATLPPPKGVQKDWREEQKRTLEICEIYDALPDAVTKESFKRIIESVGENFPSRLSRPYRVSGNHQIMDRREFRDPDHTQMRQRQFKDAEHIEHHHRRHSEEDQKKPTMDPTEYSDMPQLEEAPETSNANPGQQPTEAQIDVEGYDSSEESQMQGDVEYIMEDDVVVEMYDRDASPLKMERGRSDVIMPDMREEYLGTMDANNYSANQIMINNQYTDSRYCPGCKLHLKRSIFYHHSRMIKKYGICNMFTPKRFPCGYHQCDERLGTVEKLCEHMFQIHGAPTEIKTEVFNTETEFEVFLRELEAKGGNFRMSRGNKMIKAGLVQYFRCNRTQSLAKEKTMRICDEVGLFGEPVGNGTIDRHDDPFTSNVAGGKPCLRTEEACTAFFRKAYMPNGTIEVRFCDHHLHEDERVRLPPPVKDRICEMHRKGLPAAVIMMVLQCEREKYALIGSCVERRIMQLTPKDISAVISTRNSNAKKRKRTQALSALNQRQDTGDDDVLQEDGQPSQPVSGSHNLQLTEIEQKMLETFEQNQDVILGDMQKLKRLENRKRNQREMIRNNVFALGRFIRTSNFSEMQAEHLDELSQAVKIAVDYTRIKVEAQPGHVQEQEMEEHNNHMRQMAKQPPAELDAEGGELMETVKQDTMAVNIVPVPFVENEETVVDCGSAEDVLQNADVDVMNNTMNSSGTLEEDRHSEEMEQIVVETDSPPTKKRRGRRSKAAAAMEEIVKQEEVEPEVNQSPFNLPSKTRAGRVVRPSRHVLDM